MFKAALAGNAAAIKAIESMPPMPPKGTVEEDHWKKLGERLEAVDSAYVAMAEALSESDLKQPVKVEWFGGNPDSVPLSFMLSQLLVHNTHHRGQISQVLDSLKIDNNFSGIEIELLPG
jgi:uncharacterized damage-inducible protein DinB